MNKYLFFTLIVFVLTGCSANDKKLNGSTHEDKVYTNEFFSLQYPYNWTVEEEINNMADTLPALSKGVRATFYNHNPYAPWHRVYVQKSAMFECFKTPEEWRDLSVELKQEIPSNPNLGTIYLGTIDELMQDSLKIGPYPAASAGFVLVTEDGDTLIHKQIVVMDGRDLYYLNNIFDWNDDGTMENRGDAILSTFRINHKTGDK